MPGFLNPFDEIARFFDKKTVLPVFRDFFYKNYFLQSTENQLFWYFFIKKFGKHYDVSKLIAIFVLQSVLQKT